MTWQPNFHMTVYVLKNDTGKSIGRKSFKYIENLNLESFDDFMTKIKNKKIEYLIKKDRRYDLPKCS